MGSNAKKKTTMGKLNREQRLREKRQEKEMRKAARKLEPAGPELGEVHREVSIDDFVVAGDLGHTSDD